MSKAGLPAKIESQPPPKQTFLKRFWEGWKRTGLFIGKVNLYILTFIVYWTVFAITSIIAKLLMRDFLKVRRKKGLNSYWAPLPESEATMESHQRQF